MDDDTAGQPDSQTFSLPDGDIELSTRGYAAALDGLTSIAPPSEFHSRNTLLPDPDFEPPTTGNCVEKSLSPAGDDYIVDVDVDEA
uniref:GG10710 n=1 Tax=Drosophila erecta TaxID=7220 RepID=B3NYJ4_DROER